MLKDWQVFLVFAFQDSMTLYYKNSRGDYQGATPRDILLALHQETLKGWRCSLEEWKEWNQKLLKERHHIDISIDDSSEAEQTLLDSLVKIGALHEAEEVPSAEK